MAVTSAPYLSYTTVGDSISHIITGTARGRSSAWPTAARRATRSCCSAGASSRYGMKRYETERNGNGNGNRNENGNGNG